MRGTCEEGGKGRDKRGTRKKVKTETKGGLGRDKERYDRG